MNEKQRKIFKRWISDLDRGSVHLANRELTHDECYVVALALQDFVADIESVLQLN